MSVVDSGNFLLPQINAIIMQPAKAHNKSCNLGQWDAEGRAEAGPTMDKDAKRSFNSDAELGLMELVSIPPSALRALQRHHHRRLLYEGTISKDRKPIED